MTRDMTMKNPELTIKNLKKFMKISGPDIIQLKNSKISLNHRSNYRYPPMGFFYY